MNILILGGTGEARELATRLTALGHTITTSLAGRTSTPLLPPGAIRIGGFGGPAGLAAYLRAHAVDHLIDATHPYAATISANAVNAAADTATPLLRLIRPPFHGDWTEAPDFPTAAAQLPANARVLVTSGHAGLADLLVRTDCTFLIRLIEPPAAPLPAKAQLLLDRPPYDLAAETALMRTNAITHLISKNSGGAQTEAKLEAARNLGIAILMIARPTKAPAREVTSVAAALHELASRR